MTLGRTWADVATTWSAETETWGTGLGAAADSGGLSFVETAVVVVPRAGSDLGALSVVEAQTSFGTLAVSDTGVLSVSEAVSNLLAFAYLVDNGSLSVSEVAALQQQLTVTDSAILGLTELQVSFLASASADDGTLVLDESGITDCILSAIDSCALSLTELVEVGVTLDVYDQLNMVVLESLQDLFINDWPCALRAPQVSWVPQTEQSNTWHKSPGEPLPNWQKAGRTENGIWMLSTKKPGADWN